MRLGFVPVRRSNQKRATRPAAREPMAKRCARGETWCIWKLVVK